MLIVLWVITIMVIETADATLSKGLRQHNGVYTQHFNIKREHAGHVFQALN